jgi:hypothetical protein
MGAFYSKPTSPAIENLTTVYVLKWAVFGPPEKGVGSHYDEMFNTRWRGGDWSRTTYGRIEKWCAIAYGYNGIIHISAW